jgi:transcription factor IIIB subunit 2
MHSNERDTVQKRLDYARDKIEELKRLLSVDSDYDDMYNGKLCRIDAAIRVIKLANDRDFFGKGRNLDNYAVAAYYIVLRIKKAPYLLIDFSDKLNVNLFKLARCFLRMVRFLGLQEKLPLIEPTIFILRYCVMLNFPEKTKKIAETAINLVKRMKRDWMSHGRRPSSLCGAAILISAKIHEVPCTARDICDTVSVCDETIKRRLD